MQPYKTSCPKITQFNDLSQTLLLRIKCSEAHIYMEKNVCKQSHMGAKGNDRVPLIESLINAKV